MLFTVFPLIYVLYFGEFLIHDSRGFMILEQRAAAREMPGVREHESLQRAVAREVPDVRQHESEQRAAAREELGV